MMAKALEIWPLHVIEEALGDDADGILPQAIRSAIAFLLCFPLRWSRTVTTFRQIGTRKRTFGLPRATMCRD